MRRLSETAGVFPQVVSCWRNEDALCRPPVTEKVGSDEADMTGGLFEARVTQQPT